MSDNTNATPPNVNSTTPTPAPAPTPNPGAPPKDSADQKAKAREERKQARLAEKAAKIEKAANKKGWEKKEPSKEGEAPGQATEGEKGDKGKGKGKEAAVRLAKKFENPTPKGHKKDLSQPMDKEYDPPSVEAAWYDWWDAKGFFSPDYVAPGKTKENNAKRQKFVIVIPPPNVTGSLHIGHALTNSIEDSFVRWHRMSGKEVLWVPGTDHAGIATQTVVEKRLWKEKQIRKEALGREEFVKKVWEWKNEYATRIKSQLRRIGSSTDWTKEVFTMDDKLSTAVKEAFVQYWDKGLVYRDNRLVNWSCALKTAISDLECEDLELAGPTRLKVPGHDPKKTYQFGMLWKFAYPIIGEPERQIVVATTRPETMLGDTAIAIHPDDERYKDLHKKFAMHPFLDRKIPIICDSDLVDMTFGTGAVKVTPAHDPNDYETGKTHKLDFINILNEDGSLNENAGEFKGMMRYDARDAVLKKLEEKGLYKGSIDNKMVLQKCERSGDIVEPVLRPQWWVNMSVAAAQSVEAVKQGKLKIIPESKTKTWFHYLENIQPWCISRQLWWGHRIPAYLIVPKGGPIPDGFTNDQWVVGRTEEEAIAAAEKKTGKPKSEFELKQDPDVLDTWFSSGLFPFSVFGWPSKTAELDRFYPTALLETGYDILFFWVARMVMMGLQLTGKLPFSEVYLHSLVRDAHGRKMSKSLGNVIDPIDVIEGITLEGLHEQLAKGNLSNEEIEAAKKGQKKDYPTGISECGTDALRFALCSYTTQGKDINMDIRRVEGYRKFCNKLWNATKFAFMMLGDKYTPNATADLTGHESNIDKWIIHRLNATINKINNSLRAYELGDASNAIHSFLLFDMCDVYFEAIKPLMNSKAEDDATKKSQAATRATLYTIMDEGLKLIHPFMPFISEELWQRFARRPGDLTESLCVACFPMFQSARDFPQIDSEMTIVNKIGTICRALQATYNITRKQKPLVTINTHDDNLNAVLHRYKDIFITLSYLGSMEITSKSQAAPKGCATEVPDNTCEVYLHIKGLVDFNQERTKLIAKRKTTSDNIDQIKYKMAQSDYIHVPAFVKEQNDEKLAALSQELSSIEKAIKTLDQLLLEENEQKQ